jgi:hypothetical protein
MCLILQLKHHPIILFGRNREKQLGGRDLVRLYLTLVRLPVIRSANGHELRLELKKAVLEILTATRAA